MSEADTAAPAADSIDPKVARDRALLLEAQSKGTGAKLGAFVRLSGPGWLQSAITLGGGSLAGSLYLGIIGGYDLMWLQPLLMILGIIMLAAIAYVTLSTGERPFRAINRHVNPVLGWGWLIAATIANLVWAMPQFSLGTAAIQQNLAPDSALFTDPDTGKWVCIALLAIIGSIAVFFYGSGGWGMKAFDILLKLMVAVIVISFFGVVVAMSMSGSLDWGHIFAGFVPDLSLISQPAEGFRDLLPATTHSEYWNDKIVTQQQNVMITAAATAVGINMTFLLPYSMLRKGWDKTFRGLAAFDLSTGLFIPFVLATSCVVIASASQFNVDVAPEVYDVAATEMEGGHRGLLADRVMTGPAIAGKPAPADDDAVNAAIDALPTQEKLVAYKLVKRDAFALANSLENLTGSTTVSQYVFGIGVLGMAISTIIILMLINGFCFAEMLNNHSKAVRLIGCLLPAVTGALGFAYLWGDGDARFWLAVPTSRIGMILLPVAYLTFFLMMNSKSLMGSNKLTGGKGLAMNIAMVIAIAVSTVGCGLAIWNTTMKIPGTEIVARGPILGAIAVFVLLAIVAHFMRKPANTDPTDS